MNDNIRQISGLSPVQEKVILALVQGATITKAAETVGVHRTTIHDWFKNDRFSGALFEARYEFAETIHDELKELTAIALAALRKLLEDSGTPASVRLRAALAVLNRPHSLMEENWALPTQKQSNRNRQESEIEKSQQTLRAVMQAPAPQQVPGGAGPRPAQPDTPVKAARMEWLNSERPAVKPAAVAEMAARVKTAGGGS